MFVATFNKWTRFVEDTDAAESNLTLYFGFLAYSEMAFAILPGILIDYCGRSTFKYLDRRIGTAIGLTIGVALHFLCTLYWGKPGNQTFAIISIIAYYAMRSFIFSSLQVAIAELYPVSKPFQHF